jgi:ABC-type tungstate transport system permease subunit
MITLNRNYYRLVNTASETFVNYDDAYRLVGWLMGKRTHNFIVEVIKGDKAKLLVISDDPLDFQKVLLATMANL